MKFLTLAVYIAGAAALGINCRGNDLCNKDAGQLFEIRDQISDMINAGNGGRYFGEMNQIACSSGRSNTICAYFQKGASGSAVDAYNHVQNLLNHGCRICGSDPTQPGNDVNNGELTVNIVDNACCVGNCQC
ncbi:hypothetical protein SEPCBS119000_006502 [Sporothrix epigloea]|uniref:Killer toxin Kp4 domain-containing protein n=1 Tax=Sporothrix epigloea TaxID=1892477 RepID=A0ABP0E3R9_9PEZI